MTTSDNWWEKPPGGGSGSLGEEIDRALGEFERALARLREELGDRRQECGELEKRIAEVERQQARAFKDLLGRNAQIRRMLSRGGKGRSAARRRGGATARHAATPKSGPPQVAPRPREPLSQETRVGSSQHPGGASGGSSHPQERIPPRFDDEDT
jgi:hypothetical protein